jgi:hypothetical protein
MEVREVGPKLWISACDGRPFWARLAGPCVNERRAGLAQCGRSRADPTCWQAPPRSGDRAGRHATRHAASRRCSGRSSASHDVAATQERHHLFEYQSPRRIPLELLRDRPCLIPQYTVDGHGDHAGTQFGNKLVNTVRNPRCSYAGQSWKSSPSPPAPPAVDRPDGSTAVVLTFDGLREAKVRDRDTRIRIAPAEPSCSRLVASARRAVDDRREVS